MWPFKKRIAWQPIKTAPKDGTWILGYGVHNEECDKMKVRICPISWSEYDRWYNCSQYPSKPTHWMPLPTPPQENK